MGFFFGRCNCYPFRVISLSSDLPDKYFTVLIVQCTCLLGALQITLEDVYHSPVGSRDGTGDQKGRLWYGSEPVLDQWFQHLVEETVSKDSGVVDMSEIMDATVPAEK